MFGFVYIWYDRRDGRFYVGSHKGTPDDGYVCSSPKMLKEYRCRPDDFKRRVLYYAQSDRLELLAAEQHWLDLIKSIDFAAKYYNRTASAKGILLLNEEARRIANQKTALKTRGSKFPPRSEQWRANISRGRKGKGLGRVFDQETRDKIGKTHTGMKHSDATKRIISAAVAARFADPEERRKQSERLTGKKCTSEAIAKRSQALIGRPGWAAGSYWVTDGTKNVQVLSDDQLPLGYRRGMRLVTATRGKVWINDGIKNALILKGSPVPDGFVVGKLNYKLRSDKGKTRLSFGAIQ